MKEDIDEYELVVKGYIIDSVIFKFFKNCSRKFTKKK